MLSWNRVSSLILHTFAFTFQVMIHYSATSVLDSMDIFFDTDSFKIGVEICASATMLRNKDLFEDLIQKDLGESSRVGGGLAIASF